MRVIQALQERYIADLHVPLTYLFETRGRSPGPGVAQFLQDATNRPKRYSVTGPLMDVQRGTFQSAVDTHRGAALLG